MGMAPSEWNQVLELFHAALEAPPEARVVLLDQACGAQTVIRQAVEDLLREHESAGSFLSRPVWDAAPSTEPFARGSRFEQFDLHDVLGRGGMGEVWSARDIELDRPVALKFLRAQPASEMDAARIVHEAQAASALNHPNIVTIHGVVRSKGIAAIVMELVEGNSLAALRKASVSIDKILSIGLQIAQALAAAHAHGIVHGDIKPENIVQRHDGYIKVLDFGLAHRVMAGHSAGPRAGFGTLRYMSPEQAHGDLLTTASDIFSFGLVMFELAAGRHPFADLSPIEAPRPKLTYTPPAPSSVNRRIPSALNSIIVAMLAKNPVHRPTAAQVAEQFATISRSRARAERRFWLLGSLGACFVIAVVIGWLLSRPSNLPQFANLRIEPLTSQDGWEAAPTFSPDGKSVAFIWSPTLETSPQLYVRHDNDSSPRQVTDAQTDGFIGPPAWSPDGKWIAFKREFESSAAIFAIPSAGGPEKKLVDLRIMHRAHALDWSPDGNELAFSDLVSSSARLGIFLLNVRTGAKRSLTCPASVEFADWDPKFSPDGRTIAFKRVHGFWDDAIDTVPASGGEARRAILQGGGIWGHAWSRDGKSLILSCQRGTTIFGLWRFPLDRRGPPERIIQGASDAITPALSQKTGRLVWVNQDEDVNVYRVAATGRQPPQRLIATTSRDRDAVYSPDGRIAFITDRSGTREIWLALADGSDQRRVTNFNGPDIDNLTWSGDGRHLAFDSRVQGRSGIFTLDCDPVNRRCSDPKMAISGMNAYAPGWSADGKLLYFASDRTGRFEIWRESAAGGQPTQITHNGGFMARESGDGRRLYFSDHGKLCRMGLPIDQFGHSTTEVVIGPPFYVQDTGWALAPDEIFFTNGAAKGQAGSLRAYRISTGATRVILPSLRNFADSRDYSLTVSPHSKWILYSQLDRAGSNVMIAENH
jgi:eukaryotic-like serine/threonine-protein kinase